MGRALDQASWALPLIAWPVRAGYLSTPACLNGMLGTFRRVQVSEFRRALYACDAPGPGGGREAMLIKN